MSIKRKIWNFFKLNVMPFSALVLGYGDGKGQYWLHIVAFFLICAHFIARIIRNTPETDSILDRIGAGAPDMSRTRFGIGFWLWGPHVDDCQYNDCTIHDKH